MKRTLLQNSLLYFCIFILGTCGGAVKAPGEETVSEEEMYPYEELQFLTVSSTGIVRAAPDQATVRLGVTSEAEEANAAQNGANRVMQQVTAALTQAGVPERFIQTSGLNLSPVYEQPQPGRERQREKIVGYRADSTITVETQQISEAGKIVDAALKAGANRLEGVSFSLQDESEHRLRAVKVAARNARREAAALAEALDVSLGALHKATSGSIPMQPNRAMALGLESTAAETPVNPGELEVRATVTLQFNIHASEEARESRSRSLEVR